MKVFIKGGYQTKFGELWNKSLEDLILESSLNSLKDSNVSLNDIDIIYIGNLLSSQIYNQNHLGALVSELLDVNIPIIRVESACASGGVAINQAYNVIKNDQYKNALVIGVEKMTDLPNDVISDYLMSAAGKEEIRSQITFAGLYALMAQKYFKDFKISEKELANVAIKNHFHASLNEKAHFPFQITYGDYVKSPTIASPLRLFDCSPVSDGACAVVITNKPFKNSVEIVASEIASDSISLAKRKNICEMRSTKIATGDALEKSGIELKNVDLVEVHDCFTIAEIIALEDMGFYKKGQGFLASKNKSSYLNGKLPVNTSGGLKACGHPVSATGVKQVFELFNQLMKRCGERQIKDAKVGMSQNIGGTGGTAVIHILKKTL